MIRIQQIGSPIRRHYKQRLTLKALGLNRIGRIANVPFTPCGLGMIAKVRHLVRYVDEDVFEEHRLVRPKKVDEATDRKLVQELLFEPKNIVADRFSKKQMRNRKTPDFKLLKDAQLQGYCEMKSPWSDWTLDFPDLQEGEFRVETRPAQAYPNLAGHIETAASQFNAVNSARSLPNILVIVNHVARRDVKDLRMALGGIRLPDGKVAPVLSIEAQKALLEAAQRIDLIAWIDPKERTCKYLIPYGASRAAEAATCSASMRINLKRPQARNPALLLRSSQTRDSSEWLQWHCSTNAARSGPFHLTSVELRFVSPSRSEN
jgi:large subunit ribosomal protein L30